MKTLIIDVFTLIKTNRRALFMVLIVFLLLSNYTAIKAGFLDGWLDK